MMRARPCTWLHTRCAGFRTGLGALLVATLLATFSLARSVASVVLRAVEIAGVMTIQRSLAFVVDMRRTLDAAELRNLLEMLCRLLTIATAGLASLATAIRQDTTTWLLAHMLCWVFMTVHRRFVFTSWEVLLHRACTLHLVQRVEEVAEVI